MHGKPLHPFRFNNRFVSALPADPLAENTRRQVPGAAYSRVLPTPVSNPKLIAFSHEVADILGIPDAYLHSADFERVFSGNHVLPGMDPFAMNYAGHQFGSWAGQLGDGRAINLAEVMGQDQNTWTLQLKGAGPTPYSRTADGRAVLRSSIREFLCSEAMHHLGVPSTRALSLILTGDSVMRDMFYDGRPALEPGAIVCRVAPSFIRFGNFQIHAARNETDILRSLMDYTITSDFPHLAPPDEAVYLEWFKEISSRTADMIVHWMRVGFVHGVMNTDNMSILGLTIDYGPYGWIDGYEKNWTPNTTDASSQRYVFGNQAAVAHWNLAQLARALLPVLDQAPALQDILEQFPDLYQDRYEAMMAQKLGIVEFQPKQDALLIADLETLLEAWETDMTLFFRLLPELEPGGNENGDSHGHDMVEKWLTILEEAWYTTPSSEVRAQIAAWLSRWQGRSLNGAALATSNAVSEAVSDRRIRMNQVNPKYVLRNYMAQNTIDKAHSGDYSMIMELLDLVRRPYEEQPKYQQYFAKRPEAARHKPGSSMLSCSS